MLLKSISFSYHPREDRVLAVVNLGTAEAWSCWFTRRLSLAMLERAQKLVTTTSPLAQRAPADHRSDLATFEREAAMATTARAMSATPTDALAASATSAELADRLKISQQGEDFRVELIGDRGGGTSGVVRRAELQRMLGMLEGEVIKAGWLNAVATPAAAREDTSKPARN
jgi:hypothetical protein